MAFAPPENESSLIANLVKYRCMELLLVGRFVYDVCAAYASPAEHHSEFTFCFVVILYRFWSKIESGKFW